MRKVLWFLICIATLASAQRKPPLDQIKKEAIAGVEARSKLTQQMVDEIFSFGELGFQEFETSKYVPPTIRVCGAPMCQNVRNRARLRSRPRKQS